MCTIKRCLNVERRINKELSDYFKLKVNAWKKKIKISDTEIYKCFRNKQSLSSIINDSLILSLREIIFSYSLLISEIIYIRNKF